MQSQATRMRESLRHQVLRCTGSRVRGSAAGAPYSAFDEREHRHKALAALSSRNWVSRPARRSPEIFCVVIP